MKTLASLMALCAFCSVVAFHPAAARAAAGCGNGIIEGGEECDGGPNLFIDGDPENGPCTTGSRCYYQFSCCKFNCQYVGTPGVPCQDGDDCSGPDVCDQFGQCQGGPAVANDTPCDDGLYCTGTESCQDGVCAGHTGDPCPGTACNHCQEGTDSCFDAADSSCSDGSACVTGGTCDGAGVCAGGVFNAGPCDDGVFCNGTDTCNAGACAIHTGDPCAGPDGDINCLESCDEGSGACLGADPDGTACDDGLYCNGAADECTAGLCSGTGSLPCDDDNDCTIDGCDESLDACATLDTSPDGTPCDNGDACSLGDECTGGVCTGSPTVLTDLCPWVLVMREHPVKDQIKTRSKVGIIGDVCGGIVKLSGRPSISSDLVADEALDSPLQLAPEMVVGEDIVSAGGAARANPKIGHLPYTDDLLSSLAAGMITAKSDASGFYDLTGSHDLATACHTARTVYPATTLALDSLAATDTFAPIKLKKKETASIPTLNVGGLNVIDIDGNIKLGVASVVELTGGGNPNTVVVLRVAKMLVLSTLSTISLTDGLTPDHTLIYVKGKKCRLNHFSFGAGTLLCSPAKVTAQGVAWVGAVYADGKVLQARDKSTFFHTPFQGF